MKTQNNLDKADALSDIICMLGEYYDKKELNKTQKAFVETLIGAGIFYVSSSNNLFSGKISKNALARLRSGEDVSLVKEHSFPRKVAANRVLTEHLESIKLDRKKFKELFEQQFGKYNLVLKEENIKLRQYQKVNVFISPEDSYEKAGIVLVDIQEEDYTLPKLKTYGKKNILKNVDSESFIVDEIRSDDMILDNGQELEIDDQVITIFHIVDPDDNNPSQTFLRFMKFVIDNFEGEIETNIILKKYFSRNSDDEIFGSSRSYSNTIKEHNGWYFNIHTGTSTKLKRINDIALALNINLMA